MAGHDEDEFDVNERLIDALTGLLREGNGLPVDEVGRFVTDVSEPFEPAGSDNNP
jgi:hypothetical protein